MVPSAFPRLATFDPLLRRLAMARERALDLEVLAAAAALRGAVAHAPVAYDERRSAVRVVADGDRFSADDPLGDARVDLLEERAGTGDQLETTGRARIRRLD